MWLCGLTRTSEYSSVPCADFQSYIETRCDGKGGSFPPSHSLCSTCFSSLSCYHRYHSSHCRQSSVAVFPQSTWPYMIRDHASVYLRLYSSGFGIIIMWLSVHTQMRMLENNWKTSRWEQNQKEFNSWHRYRRSKEKSVMRVARSFFFFSFYTPEQRAWHHAYAPSSFSLTITRLSSTWSKQLGSPIGLEEFTQKTCSQHSYIVSFFVCSSTTWSNCDPEGSEGEFFPHLVPNPSVQATKLFLSHIHPLFVAVRQHKVVILLIWDITTERM